MLDSEVLDGPSGVTFIPFLASLEEIERHAAEELMQDLVDKISKRLNGEVTTEVLEGHPRERIVQTAKKWEADLIVVGSHGRKGVTRFTLGSVSSAVVAVAPCSTLVVRLPAHQHKGDEAHTLAAAHK